MNVFEYLTHVRVSCIQQGLDGICGFPVNILEQRPAYFLILGNRRLGMSKYPLIDTEFA